MGRPGKSMTASLDLRTKMSNKKKEKFTIADMNNQDFRKFLNRSKNSPYLGYKSKQVHKKPI